MNYLERLLSQPELKNMLNTIYDSIYIVNTSREIMFWNRAAEKLTGFLHTEVMHKRCADNVLNHINSKGKLLCKSDCPLMMSMRTKSNVEEKVYLKKKDGSRLPVLTHVSPIHDEQGNVVGAIEVFRDVSKEEDFRILQEKFNAMVKKYISQNTYTQIIDQIEKGKTSNNALREMTILYIDVVDFTALSEKSTPDQVAMLLNDLFSICDVITRECFGDIDKFIGDAIMSTFLDANDAVAAAKKILTALEEFNFLRAQNGEDAIALHVGMHSGKVIQVEIGTKDRKDYTVVGDVVNTASRIQSLSLPNTIYLSEATKLKLHSSSGMSYLGEEKLKGKQELIKLYSISL